MGTNGMVLTHAAHGNDVAGSVSGSIRKKRRQKKQKRQWQKQFCGSSSHGYQL